MITNRPIEHNDLPVLAASLANDEFHTETQPAFFLQPGTVCNVYEDEQGPIMFVRGGKTLRLDIQFADNNDSERNAAAMLGGFEGLAERAKANGFTEIVFCSDSRPLRAFCKRRFKFREVEGELRKSL